MITFELKYDDLVHRKLSDKLFIRNTDSKITISECITLFSSEIKWDGMYTLNDAMLRISKGDIFFAGYYDDVLFGYCWLTKVKKSTFKIYNVFSKKTEEPREYGATDMLYKVIKNYTYGSIIAEIDDWNEKSMNVFRKLGFKVSELS